MRVIGTNSVSTATQLTAVQQAVPLAFDRPGGEPLRAVGDDGGDEPKVSANRLSALVHRVGLGTFLRARLETLVVRVTIVARLIGILLAVAIKGSSTRRGRASRRLS